MTHTIYFYFFAKSGAHLCFRRQPSVEAGRQQYFPQPRAASLEEVSTAASTPAAATTSAAPSTTAAVPPPTTTITSALVKTENKVNATASSGDSKKRSPEVQDSIAAVASQLLNERPAMMDVRKPVAQAEPVDKKWEKVVVTNAVPLKVFLIN